MTNALKYLETYPKQNTVRVYKIGIRNFLKAIYGIDDINQADKYVSEERNHAEDIQTYFITIKDKPPKSIQTSLSIVRTFFVENGIQVDDLVWRRLGRRINGKGPVSKVHIPTPDEFKSILSHMNIKGRAFFLTLASSGMRDGETLQLKLTDLDLSSDPARIDISAEYAKGGNRRIAFISNEAKEAIQEWLKIRDKYISSSSKKSKGALESRGLTHKEKSVENDNRVFPFSYSNAIMMWATAIEKIGLGEKDERTGRRKTPIHTLRKLFRTEMATLIPVDIVEALMGHRGYLTAVYRVHTVERLGEFYKRGESAVTFFGSGIAEEQLRQERDELNQTRDGLQSLAITLNATNARLQDRQADMEVELKVLRHTVAAFEQKVDDLRNEVWSYKKEADQFALEEERAEIMESYVHNSDEFDKYTQRARELAG